MPEKEQGWLADRASSRTSAAQREESIEVRLMSWTEETERLKATGWKAVRHRGKSKRTSEPMWEPGVGGRQPGGTDSPDKGGESRAIGIRGSLQTKASRHATVA
jgi:hypothetical protein